MNNITLNQFDTSSQSISDDKTSNGFEEISINSLNYEIFVAQAAEVNQCQTPYSSSKESTKIHVFKENELEKIESATNIDIKSRILRPRYNKVNLKPNDAENDDSESSNADFQDFESSGSEFIPETSSDLSEKHCTDNSHNSEKSLILSTVEVNYLKEISNI